MSNNKRHLYRLNNVKKDPDDPRDYIAKIPVKADQLPESADLRQYAREIENQGHVGSCVGNAVASELELYGEALLNVSKNFSRLFIYWNARYLSGLQDEDNGAYLRDGVKCCNKWGICTEDIWPYDENEVNTRPSDEAYEAARPNRVIRYERIDVGDINTVKGFLAFEKKSVVIGMGLGEKFFDISGPLEDQDYPPINNDDNQYVGGHAMNIVGYDDNLNGGSFIVENSWGTGWGDNGYWAMTYEVFNADVWDIWVVTELKVDMQPDDPDYVPSDEDNSGPTDPDFPLPPKPKKDKIEFISHRIQNFFLPPTHTPIKRSKRNKRNKRKLMEKLSKERRRRERISNIKRGRKG
jgi:C1A family cysteine protease